MWCIHLLVIPPDMASQLCSERSVPHLYYAPCFEYIFLILIYFPQLNIVNLMNLEHRPYYYQYKHLYRNQQQIRKLQKLNYNE